MARIIPLYPNKRSVTPAVPTEPAVLKKEFRGNLSAVVKKSIREMADQPVKKWLSPLEACQALNISSRALRRLRIDGLPHALVGKEIYFDPGDIEKQLQRLKRASALKKQKR